MIDIIIVDDHFLIREGLRRILNHELDMAVVEEFTSAHDLSSHLLETNKTYNVLILEISLPDSNGLETLKNILKINPKLNILILSIHPEHRFAQRALKSGAKGYINKSAPKNELLKAIRKVSLGRSYISEALSETLAMRLDKSHQKHPHENLSDREYEVLRLIGKGKSANQIAEILSLSPSTVHTYKTRIFEKMNMETRAELMYYVIYNDLIF